MCPVLLAPLFVISTLTISGLARSVNNHFQKLPWREKLEDSGLSHFRKPMISVNDFQLWQIHCLCKVRYFVVTYSLSFFRVRVRLRVRKVLKKQRALWHARGCGIKIISATFNVAETPRGLGAWVSQKTPSRTRIGLILPLPPISSAQLSTSSYFSFRIVVK